MNQYENNQDIINLIALKQGEKAVFIGIDKQNNGFPHTRGHRGRWRRGHRKSIHDHGKFLFPVLIQRLEAMGIRSGVSITKISDHFLYGPVIILVGRTQLAIGYGMAVKILVKRERKNYEENTSHGQS